MASLWKETTMLRRCMQGNFRERKRPMAQERQETREQEVARVHSYLASQSLRRTPAQLVETLQEAHQQFLTAVATVPDALSRTTPSEGEWSALDVLLHMRTMAAFDASAIAEVLERGEQPPDIQDAIVPAPQEMTRSDLLADPGEVSPTTESSRLASRAQCPPGYYLEPSRIWRHELARVALVRPRPHARPCSSNPGNRNSARSGGRGRA